MNNMFEDFNLDIVKIQTNGGAQTYSDDTGGSSGNASNNCGSSSSVSSAPTAFCIFIITSECNDNKK